MEGRVGLLSRLGTYRPLINTADLENLHTNNESNQNDRKHRHSEGTDRVTLFRTKIVGIRLRRSDVFIFQFVHHVKTPQKDDSQSQALTAGIRVTLPKRSVDVVAAEASATAVQMNTVFDCRSQSLNPACLRDRSVNDPIWEIDLLLEARTITTSDVREQAQQTFVVRVVQPVSPRRDLFS